VMYGNERLGVLFQAGTGDLHVTFRRARGEEPTRSGVRDRSRGIVGKGQSLRRLLARRFFLLTLAAHEADDVGRETFVVIHLEPSERKPRAGSCGVFKTDKAARLVGTTEYRSFNAPECRWFLARRQNKTKSRNRTRRRRSARAGNRNCENPMWPKARPSSPIDLRLWLSPQFFCGLDFRFPDSAESGIHVAG
jgi:hypothetical protein